MRKDNIDPPAIFFHYIYYFQPFNPLIGLLTIIREVKKWGTIELENDGDLLDIVLESSQDWERLRFKWSGISIDMGHDGILEQVKYGTFHYNRETLY